MHYALLFLGALFLTNMIPHLVNGLSGRAFQSPFASPPGRGLSSARTNVIWGMANLAAAWALLVHWGRFDLTAPLEVLVVGLTMLAAGLGLATAFAPLNGGLPR